MSLHTHDIYVWTCENLHLLYVALVRGLRPTPDCTLGTYESLSPLDTGWRIWVCLRQGMRQTLRVPTPSVAYRSLQISIHVVLAWRRYQPETAC